MNYLKKFITANIYSLLGYAIFVYTIYWLTVIFNSGTAGEAAALATVIKLYFWFRYLLIFIYAILIEFIIKFIISKMLKKEIKLNFKIPKYDFFFRFGFLLSFSFPIIILTPFIWCCIESIIKMLTLTDMIIYGDFTNTIRGIIYYALVLDFFIKIIFNKK